MPVQEVTANEAVQNVENSRIFALSAVSWVYKGLLKATELGVAVTDNSLGRVSTLSYTTKSLHAKLGALKDVQTKEVAKILLDDTKSFKEKLSHSVGHVRKNYSHETTVALGMDIAKYKVALGVGALAALMAPAAAAVTVGTIAGGVALWAAKYYLASHSGHGAESKLANSLHHIQESGLKFLKSLRAAAKGKNPEANHMVELADDMVASHGHGKGHGHGHGHHHHHEKFHHTLLQDLKNLIHPTHMKQSTSKFVQNMKAEGMGLKEHVVTQKNALATHATEFYNKITEPKVKPAQEMKLDSAMGSSVDDKKPQVASKKPQNNSPKM